MTDDLEYQKYDISHPWVSCVCNENHLILALWLFNTQLTENAFCFARKTHYGIYVTI